MTAQDDLRILVDDTYPEMVANLNTMLANLNQQKTLTINEIVTINDAVLDGAETGHEARLEAIRAANGYLGVYFYGDYGTVNLTDWTMYTAAGSPHGATYVSADVFRITTFPWPTYIPGSWVLAQPGAIRRQILSVSTTRGPVVPPATEGPILSITVTLVAGTPALPPGLTTVDNSVPVAVSDAELSQHQNAFAVGYDQLTHPVDITGTYGLYPRLDQINTGIDVQTINRNKFDQFSGVYDPYAT